MTSIGGNISIQQVAVKHIRTLSFYGLESAVRFVSFPSKFFIYEV